MNDVIGHGMSCPCGTSVRAILPTHGVYLLPCVQQPRNGDKPTAQVCGTVDMAIHSTPPVTAQFDEFL